MHLLGGRWRGFFLGAYMLTDELAGTAYVAQHLVLRRNAVVRIMPWADARVPALAAAWQERARLQASVRHPCVAPIFDFASDGDLQFVVRDYIEGAGLRSIVQRAGPLAAPLAAAIAAQLVDACAHVRDLGYIMQRLEPDEVVLGRDGVASIVNLTCVAPNVAPEMAHRNNADQAAHVQPPIESCGSEREQRLIGSLLFEMLSGLCGESDGPEAEQALRIQSVPDSLRVILRRMTGRAAQSQYDSLRAAGDALRSWGQASMRGL